VKKIALLGSTGSIGTQTLEVVDEFADGFQIQIISGHKNSTLLLKQAFKYNPQFVILTDRESYELVERELKDSTIQVLYGIDGLIRALNEIEIDLVVGAIAGAAGIRPIIEALELGIDVALANKETIVAAGPIVKKIQAKTGAKILPVDS